MASRPKTTRARPKPQPAPNLLARTPAAEWIAATLGGLLTLAVLGYTLWEGVTADSGPPRLSVGVGRWVATSTGHILPIIVQNASRATAADVEVRARLMAADGAPEERRTRFAYVPGRGAARGGVVFQRDPAQAQLEVTVDGYADP